MKRKDNKMKRYMLLFILLLGCGSDETAFSDFDLETPPPFSDSLSPQEKADLLPNELFVAVVDKKPIDALEDILATNGSFIYTINKEENSSLSLAIQFNNLEAAFFIVKQLSPEHLLHTNKKGEGYIYMASQKGYVELMKLIANKFRESKMEFLSDYEFSDLDIKTQSGERAIHVAKNHATAEALKYEYWRGWLEYPLRKFQFLQNNEGQSFLHTAVRDNNPDLLRWGLTQNCTDKQEWKESSLFFRYPAFVWRGIQSYGKGLGLDWDDLINTQDNVGRTAIHFSAEKLFLEGVQVLASCQWTDYLLKDDKGNIPLQSFLSALDFSEPEHSQEVKNTFTLLMESHTKLSFKGIADHVDSSNLVGDTSLHIAARLADPFFYKQLKKYGDIENKNKQEQTPKNIFALKREQLQ